jgi:hypothetical protein
MQASRLSLLFGICSLLLLSGCGSSSSGSSRGTEANASSPPTNTGGGPPADPIGGVSAPAGSNDVVVATSSVAGPVSVEVGAAQTVSITFTSSDGNVITGFGVSGILSNLPAGWSGPGSFACATVSAGSGCVLNLTYAPAAADSGTLTLNYIFVNNATMPSTGGSINIAYAATPHNNVKAAAAPTGEIDAVVGGGGQSVSVNFTTDDGDAATMLTLTTNLAALPAGWTSAASSFSCAIVTTGNGCQLLLNYAPVGGGRGTLTLNYSYMDGSGAGKTGALNIRYSAASGGTVVATASPAGEIDAIEKAGGKAVALTFTTDDGKPATRLYLTPGATLPAGWSGAIQSFTCATVSTGNGCQLHLNYAPLVLTSGTLVLGYAYTDSGGMPEAGTLTLDYAATTNDNAVATTTPTGQIDAVVGQGAQAVSIGFTTDDGRQATALQLTSSLGALPAGWSSALPSFACAGFSVAGGCQLTLMYAPPAAASGTLPLSFTYLNNAGESKSVSVNIAYRATTNDTVVGTPSLTPVTVTAGSSAPLTVTFTTDDGNLASGLLLTSDLAALPAGWSSSSSSFACAAVSVGTTCQLSLTYSPAAVDTGTLSLTYNYADDSGTSKSGTVSVPYSATP